MTQQVWWYATRAAGIMSWSTAIASILVGLLLSTRLINKKVSGPWMLDLHRFFGGLSALFLFAHIFTLWADSYVYFGPRELFVPFASEWRPGAVAFGVVGAWTLIAVEVSSLFRHKLNKKVWYVVHLLSFITAITATVHAFLSGSDMKNPIVLAVAGAGTVLVVALGVWRAKRRGKRDVSEREAMLIEMRDRLEQMPIGRTIIEPELVPLDPDAMPYRPEPIEEFDPHSSDGPRTGVLLEGLNDPIPSSDPVNEPRPSPFIGSSSNSEPTNEANPVGPGGFTADPFDAVPHFTGEHETEPTTAPAAPTASPFDSYRAAPAEPPISAPAEVEAITTSPAAAPSIAEQLAEQLGRGRDQADRSSTSATPTSSAADDEFWNRRKADPFEDSFDDMTATIANDDSDNIRPNPTVPARDRTPMPAPRQSSLPTRRPGSTFTGPVKKSPAIAEVLASKATAAPAPPAATTLQQGPPEVPAPTGDAAVDQAAYAAWLVDWLSYAECYGEETPEDPSRVSVG